MIVIFGLVLAEIAMVYFSVVSSNNNKKTYKNMATSLSNTVALSIDVTKVKNLTNQIVSIYNSYEEKPTRETQGTPEYEEYMASLEAVKQTQDYKDLQSYLHSVKEANVDTEAVYLGWVDYDRKYTVYLVYDVENEFFPVGIIDDLYEEDYPLTQAERHERRGSP